MNVQIRQTTPGDALWPLVAGLFPRAIGWMNDPNGNGDYRFFAATGDAGTFLGGSVIDIGRMGLGPLSETIIGFLEDIEVLEPHRRKGVGTDILRATLYHAWQSGCHSVRWIVDYQNEAGIALYQKCGLGFVPDEDPDAEQPEKQYTVVAINPERVKTGYACQPVARAAGRPSAQL